MLLEEFKAFLKYTLEKNYSSVFHDRREKHPTFP